MYADPLKFQPQRFVEDGRFVAKSNGFFGGGTHICLGRNHAMFQTPIALAQMLKFYDFELLGEAREESFLRAGTALTDLWVRATPRGA
jgi:cytochrome P450